MKKSILNHTQDSVMSDYVNSLRLTKEDTGKLHMFFSPNRVPIGLTDKEVIVCINLYSLKKKSRRRSIPPKQTNSLYDIEGELAEAINTVMYSDDTLPEEFYPNRPMTRARFKRGVIKFIFGLKR